MSFITQDAIGKMIYIIRGQKVMIDSDLANLYEVPTKRLNEQVKRNFHRFPHDFMFQLTNAEFESLRSQFATSKQGRGGRRHIPLAFTEHGIAMLSSVLNSDRAIEVNISIIRTFVNLRQLIAGHQSLNEKIRELEVGSNKIFKVVFERLDSLEDKIKPHLPDERKKIGLQANKKT
ncbi:MAG: ORF6N domain-containing protein [Pseudomonadota bacterium]